MIGFIYNIYLFNHHKYYMEAVLDMVYTAVVLLANFSSCQILVAHVPQDSAEWCLTLLLLLLLAALGIQELTDVSGGLLLVSLLLLFLVVLGPHGGNASLPLPVSPHVG